MTLQFETTSVPDRIKDETVISNTRNYNSPHVDDIEYLWVHEDHRNKDIATHVMALAEDEARKRGCSHAMLDTYEFQALDFYIKQGYECFGKLDGYCEKYERYYLKKAITASLDQET